IDGNSPDDTDLLNKFARCVKINGAIAFIILLDKTSWPGQSLFHKFFMTYYELMLNNNYYLQFSYLTNDGKEC
ncbi:hypothetical protein WA026_016916, partial [Henosepilachna vigintioctopunctata]